MKIAFVVPGLNAAEASYSVLMWAQVLSRYHDVYVVADHLGGGGDFPFLAPDAPGFQTADFAAVRTLQFDLALATTWLTAFALHRLHADRIGLFQQTMESQQFPAGSHEQDDVHHVLASGLPILAAANWLRDYDVRYMGVEASLVQTLIAGMDRAQWRPLAPQPAKGKGPRFLVAVAASEAPQTSQRVTQLLGRQGCDFLAVEAVPFRDLPAIYAAADVLILLGTSGGTSQQALAMFACGGTVLTWDLWGSEEAVAHMHNALVVPLNDLAAVEAAVRRLVDEPALVARLCRNAQRTAAAWPSWDEQAAGFDAALADWPAVKTAPILATLAAQARARTTRPKPRPRPPTRPRRRLPPRLKTLLKRVLPDWAIRAAPRLTRALGLTR